MAASNILASNSFADFHLEVGSGRVLVLKSPAGELRAGFRAPFSKWEAEALRDWMAQARANDRRIGGRPGASLDLANPQQLGEILFRALFSNEIYSLYKSSRALARDRGEGLRIKLNLADPEVEALPWELLYDPSEDYLVLTPNVTLARYISVPLAARPTQVTRPLRILLAAGKPDGLDLEAEVRAIQVAVAPLVEANEVQLTALTHATLPEVLEHMQRQPFHMFHFLGHGEGPTETSPAHLLFWGPNNSDAYQPVDQIWRVLRQQEALRLVWLNSCSGAEGQSSNLNGPLASAAARLVTIGVSAVVANQVRISDSAAIQFARAFYRQLALYKPVDVALSAARLSVSTYSLGSLEWATPVLYMRAPDGVLFAPPEEPAPSVAEAASPVGGSSVVDFGVSNKYGSISIGDVAGRDIIKGNSYNFQGSLYERLRDQLRALQRRRAKIERQHAVAPDDPDLGAELASLHDEIARLESQISRLSS